MVDFTSYGGQRSDFEWAHRKGWKFIWLAACGLHLAAGTVCMATKMIENNILCYTSMKQFDLFIEYRLFELECAAQGWQRRGGR